MKNLEAITTVYSYRFPEIRDIVAEVARNLPQEIYFRSVKPVGGLDNFHEPIIDKIIDFYSDYASGLKNFRFRYPTMGSEEGIREIMTKLQYNGIKEIYMLKGDYEGYKAVAETRKIKTIEVDENINPKKLRRGYWFMSNPSAKDGNIIPNNLIKEICEAGHKLFYDLAYLGSTKRHNFDLSHENIFASVVSFSKPFGLFYDRIGFTFSRDPIGSLYGNKWFKNILNLKIAENIVTELKPNTLYNRYRPFQQEIISDINKDFGLNVKASDALLLGYMRKRDVINLNLKQRNLIKEFKRGESYRFCLTKYYIEKIKKLK